MEFSRTWTRKAEDWLLDKAGIPGAERGPYRGRGEPERLQKRRPVPRFTSLRGGEEHGFARAWEVRSSRYRDLARALLEGRAHTAQRIARAVGEDPPRGADQVWLERDQRVAAGQAWPADIQRWGEEAKAIAREASARVAAARRRAWVEWANEAWAKKPGKLYAWCKGERGPNIVATRPEGGGWLLDPAKVVGHATDCWAALWNPGGEVQEPVGLPFDELPGMPPLSGEILHGIAAHLHVDKAGGLDGWTVGDLRRLPVEAFEELAGVLALVEREGVWPRGLSGAVVTLLPKKGDHGPMAQRPISLLPMIYRLWAAARAGMLKEWFAAAGHESAWGQGLGKGADTAAWMGAVQAELAKAKGDAAYGAFIDCEKCYDHVRLGDLEFEGCAQGLGRLVRLAARQYRGTRYVRWAGAIGRGVGPTRGIPAGCPLANGMLHLYLLRAMKRTQEEATPAKLRTYVDDWRLFVSGARRRAAGPPTFPYGLHS